MVEDPSNPLFYIAQGKLFPFLTSSFIAERNLVFFLFFSFTDAPVAVAHLATGYFLDTLREGDDLKLVCDIQSNPPPTSIVWYQDVSPPFMF